MLDLDDICLHTVNRRFEFQFSCFVELQMQQLNLRQPMLLLGQLL